jgi:hypothetical protein
VRRIQRVDDGGFDRQAPPPLLKEARSSGWEVLREETTPGDWLLVYLARPLFRAQIGFSPDDREHRWAESYFWRAWSRSQ